MDNYSPGIDCKCFARAEVDCSCADADWRSVREVELEAEVERLREFAQWCADIEKARDLWGGMSDLDWFVAIEERAKEALDAAGGE